jgi:flagellar biosynthesis GTPase FlhF
MSGEGDRRRNLRELPRKDYHWQLQGIPISVQRPTITKEESNLEEEITSEEGSTLAKSTLEEATMEQLATVLAELARFQQEQQRRLEEQEERHRQQEDERRQREKETSSGRERRLQQEEERRQREEERCQYEEEKRRLDEKRRRQEFLEEQEQVKTILQGAIEVRKKAETHLKMEPYQEKEDIQDFLEAFEGIIMKIQETNKAEWVLRLTPLLNGKKLSVLISDQMRTMRE